MNFVRVAVCLLVLVMAAPAFADAGDAGMDAGSDMGSDMGSMDAGSDMGSMDAGSEMDAAMDSGAPDAGPTPDPVRLSISGSAVLSTSEAASIEVVLMSADGEAQTDFTDAGGRFEFDNLAAGAYDLSATYPGFITQTRSLELRANTREDFVLFPDVTFDVAIDVTFVEGGGPVTVEARSLGRMVTAEREGSGEVPISLGAGPWQVAISSPGFVPVTLSFELAADRPTDEPVAMFAVLERAATPEITSDAGCSCTSTPAAPDGALLLVLLGAVRVMWRRRNR